MGFTPLKFTHFDGRGRKSKEPPPTDSRGLLMGLPKTPRSRKNESKSEPDEATELQLVDKLVNITKRSEDITPPFALRSNKRKYGYSAAERKEKQRAAHLKKHMEYDEKIKKRKLTEQMEMVDENKDEKDVGIEDLIGKENVSPQKSECDFGGAELFEFKQSLTAFNGENESDTEDEESPIKRRLFTKKRVIEESDSNSGELVRMNYVTRSQRLEERSWNLMTRHLSLVWKLLSTLRESRS
jgi:hypothetical protein